MNLRELLYLNNTGNILSNMCEYYEDRIILLNLPWMYMFKKVLERKLSKIVLETDIENLMTDIVYIATSTSDRDISSSYDVYDIITIYNLSSNSERQLKGILVNAIKYIQQKLELDIAEHINTLDITVLFCSIDDIFYFPKKVLTIKNISIYTQTNSYVIAMSIYVRK